MDEIKISHIVNLSFHGGKSDKTFEEWLEKISHYPAEDIANIFKSIKTERNLSKRFEFFDIYHRKGDVLINLQLTNDTIGIGINSRIVRNKCIQAFRQKYPWLVENEIDDTTEIPVSMSPEEEIELLEQEKKALYADRERIATQINDAKTRRLETGEFADPTWFRNANSAYKKRGLRIQELQDLISAKKNEIRLKAHESLMADKKNRSESHAKIFIEVAKEALDEETFAVINAKAKVRFKAQQDSDKSDLNTIEKETR